MDHRRKARRGWAYSALRDKRISKIIVGKLLQSFSTYGDQEALHLIARNPEHVAELDSDMILSNIQDRYWRGRVVHALITSKSYLDFPELPFRICSRRRSQRGRISVGAVFLYQFARCGIPIDLRVRAWKAGRAGRIGSLTQIHCRKMARFTVEVNRIRVDIFPSPFSPVTQP